MHLTNEVVLPAPPDEVFSLINDVERVAPCMPGAQLDGRSADDAYRGRVKVKVGPISAAYSGTVRFLEVDRAGQRLVLDARGSEQHGSGNAEAKVRVQVRPHDEGSALALDTDLVIQGKVAQFGGGALGDVSQKLMEQFARNLGDELTRANGAPAPAEPASTPETAQPQQEAALDGLSLVASPLVKRAGPVLASVAAGVVIGAVFGRSRKRGALADELLTATVHIGQQTYSVPARRVTTLVGRR